MKLISEGPPLYRGSALFSCTTTNPACQQLQPRPLLNVTSRYAESLNLCDERTVCRRVATIGAKLDAHGVSGEAVVVGQEGALNAAKFVVADAGSGGASGGEVGGGAFTLDRDAMTSELDNLRKLKDRVDKQVEMSRPMWSIQSPGTDPASLRNTDASNKSGLSYREFLLKQSRSFAVIIGKIETALGMHSANDDQAAQAVNTQANGERF